MIGPPGYPVVRAIAVGPASMIATVDLGPRGPQETMVTSVVGWCLCEGHVPDDVRAAAATIRAWWDGKVTASGDDLMAIGTDASVHGSGS